MTASIQGCHQNQPSNSKLSELKTRNGFQVRVHLRHVGRDVFPKDIGSIDAGSTSHVSIRVDVIWLEVRP